MCFSLTPTPFLLVCTVGNHHPVYTLRFFLLLIVPHKHLLLRLVAVSRQCFPWAGRDCIHWLAIYHLVTSWLRKRGRTGICEGNRWRIVVADGSSDRRNNHHHDGAHGSKYDGPEVGWLLAGCPLDKADGVGPESRCDGDDHCEGLGAVTMSRLAVCNLYKSIFQQPEKNTYPN
jgi:hypothetical protein